MIGVGPNEDFQVVDRVAQNRRHGRDTKERVKGQGRVSRIGSSARSKGLTMTTTKAKAWNLKKNPNFPIWKTKNQLDLTHVYQVLRPRGLTTEQGYIKHETEHLPDQDSVSSPDFGQRRTSNRQHKTPARFLDESLSPAPHSSTSAHPHPPSALKDPLAFDDTDQSDDDEPLSSRRVTNKASSTLKKTTSNEESSVRPLRTRKPKKTDKDFKYLNDDEGSLEDEDEQNSSGKNLTRIKNLFFLLFNKNYTYNISVTKIHYYIFFVL